MEGGDKRVISFVRSISPHEKVCYHHIEFPSYKGVEVEVHYRPSFLLCFWHNRKLQKYYERVKNEQFSHRVMLGEQGEIAIPTVEFNLIFQLTHIFSHLMNEGIGLRQLLDYYYVISMLSVNCEMLTSLQKELKELGLWRFAGGIMCGISSGTNVAAALKLARKLGEGKTVVTVLPDTAERYFSTPLFEE